MDLNPDILEKLKQLEEKYSAMGQDMASYLEGLLHSNGLAYWDYIHLDTLLSLQNPRTDFPDEKVFIAYHQITELYFNLILHEMEQLEGKGDDAGLDEWKKRLKRIINYFKNLTNSFDVMVEGMDRDQFLRFRMSLLPASGFQSVQYRMIEMESTPLINLVKIEERGSLSGDESLEELYEKIYWKSGNIEMRSGKKTLTLLKFEEKYDYDLLDLAEELETENLYARYQRLPDNLKSDPGLINLMRDLDVYANLFWPLSHYRSAVKYLQGDPDTISATGGTNWQKFLPPKFQKIIFFPELWSEREKEEWGKAWVLDLFKEKVEANWGKIS